MVIEPLYSRRWLAGLGAIMVLVLAVSAQRYVHWRDLAAEVSEELALARAALGEARGAALQRTELAAKASAAFDTQVRKDAEQLWDQVDAQRDRADRGFRDASRHAEIALAKDPTSRQVRDLIGDILLERAMLAERIRDLARRDELIERLALYDADGSRRARWNALGRVVVHAPPGTTITLEPGRQLGTGTIDVWLPPGSHVLAIAAPGCAVVRAPILVERGGVLAVDVALPRVEDVPPGFVYVPPGTFVFGSAHDEDRREFFETAPLHPRSTAAFLIGRTEVTFGDWLAYLDALPASERAMRTPSVSNNTGVFVVTPDGAGHWRIDLDIDGHRYSAGWDEPLTYSGRTRRASQDWRRLPVVGVSAVDATAYAAWLDDTDRIPGARLCSEIEWERAARGADDRGYPAGRLPEADDININTTYGPGMMGPDEVGSHPASRGPFGLDDMSGNVFEWTVSEDSGYTARGGSYLNDRKTAHLANRVPAVATWRHAAIGFRLCATPPLPR
jgi:eukaryotic-like serine/threonine-protein kinase